VSEETKDPILDSRRSSVNHRFTRTDSTRCNLIRTLQRERENL